MGRRPRRAAMIAIEQRARIRLAATNVGVRCAEAVDLAYNTGGGSSVYSSSPLQRCFRDIHTATQHLMVSPRRVWRSSAASGWGCRWTAR